MGGVVVQVGGVVVQVGGVVVQVGGVVVQVGGVVVQVGGVVVQVGGVVVQVGGADSLFPLLTTDLTIGKSDTSILDKVHTELEYLDGRVEFWRQQKPMYARKREKELKRVKPEPTKPIGMSLRPAATTNNHVKYIIKSLKDIDSGEPVA